MIGIYQYWSYFRVCIAWPSERNNSFISALKKTNTGIVNEYTCETVRILNKFKYISMKFKKNFKHWFFFRRWKQIETKFSRCIRYVSLFKEIRRWWYRQPGIPFMSIYEWITRLDPDADLKTLSKEITCIERITQILNISKIS